MPCFMLGDFALANFASDNLEKICENLNLKLTGIYLFASFPGRHHDSSPNPLGFATEDFLEVSYINFNSTSETSKGIHQI